MWENSEKKLVQIEYRRVKNINLYIKPPDGRVLITAPPTVSKKRIMEFVKEKQEWIEQARRRVQSTAKKEAISADISKAQAEHLRENLELCARKWEPLMGVHAAGWTIRDMRTRWGSCTPSSGRIRINKRLALYPVEYLEYIVVHELCHLLEPSHNERFKSYMTKFMPDWKERRKRMKNMV